MTTVPTELETIGRLVLATVLGFVIGLEPEAERLSRWPLHPGRPEH